MLSHPPNLDYINTPVLMIQVAEEMQYNRHCGEALPPSFIKLLYAQAEQLRAHAEYIGRYMKPIEAKRMLPSLRKPVAKFFEDRDAFEAKYAHLANTESYIAFVSMFDAVQALVGEITFVAANRKVDKALYVKILVEEAIGGEPVAGADALAALFA